MADEDRCGGKVAFLDRLSAFNEERGASNNTSPTISKQPLDLFLLYNLVQKRGGFAEVCRGRHWKECAQLCGITISSSAAYTLKKQYIKHLLPFECKYDRNDIPVEVLLQQTESASKSKHGKHGKGSAPSPGPGDSNSQGSVSSASTCSYPTSGTPNPGPDSQSSPFPPQSAAGQPYPQSQPQQQQPQLNPAAPPPHATGPYAPQYNGYGQYGHSGHPVPAGNWTANPAAPPAAGPQQQLLPGDSLSAQDPFSDEMQPAPDARMSGYPQQQQQQYRPPHPQQQPQQQQQQPPPHPSQSQQQQQHQQPPRTTPPATPVPNSGPMPGHPYPVSGGKPAAASSQFPGFGPRVPHPHPSHGHAPDGRMPNGQSNSSNNYGYPGSHIPHDNRQSYQADYNNRGQRQPGPPVPPAGHPASNGYSNYRPPPGLQPGSTPPQSYYSQQQPPQRYDYGRENRAYDQVNGAEYGHPGQQQQHPAPLPPQHQQQPPHGQSPHPPHQPPQLQQQQQQQHVPGPAPVPSSTSGPSYSQPPPTPSSASPAAYGQQSHPASQMPPSSTTPVSSYGQHPGPYGHPQMSSGGKPNTYPYASTGHPVPPHSQQQQPHPQQQPSIPQQQPPPPQQPHQPQSQPPHPHHVQHPGMDNRSSASPAGPPAPGYPPSQTGYDPRYGPGHAAGMQSPGDRYPGRPDSAGEYGRPVPPSPAVHANGYPPHGYRQQAPPPHPPQSYYGPHHPGQRYDSRGYEHRPDMSQYGPPAAQHPVPGHPLPPSAAMPPQNHSAPMSQAAAPIPPPLSHGRVMPPGPAPIPSPYGPNREQGQRFPVMSHPQAHHPPQQQPQQQHQFGPQFMASQSMRRELTFPPSTVESAQPKLVKRRRITARDVSQIEAWRLLMCLKSGLLAESTWALDVLSVLLHDDSTFQYFGLQSMPGLLNTLLEHFRKYLQEIFDGLLDSGSKKNDYKCDSRVTENGGNAAVTTEKSDDGHVIECDVPDAPVVSRYRMRKLQKRKVRKWFEIDEDVKENSHPHSPAATKSPNETTVKSEPNQNSIPPASAFPLTEQDPQPLVLLNGSMNYTLKSQDGKPVKIINCSNGSIPDGFPKDVKSLLNGLFGEEDPITSDEKDWDQSCHILTQFASKEKYVRFVKLIGNRKIVIPNHVHANGHVKHEEKHQVKQEQKQNHPPASKAGEEDKQVPPDDNATREESDESRETAYPRFRGTDSKKRKHDLFDELEEEAYYRDHPPLCAVDEYSEGLSRRCLCLSTLIRNLSFVPQNDVDMARHQDLLLVLSRLVLLHHDHPVRKKHSDVPLVTDEPDSLLNEEDVKPEQNQPFEDDESSDIDSGSNEWYWDTMHLLLENTLVTLSNIAGQLDLSPFPEEVSLPLLDGLLHWAVCPSSYAQDNMPMTSISNLSPQRLALEVLVKLSIRDSNVDLILATPPWERLHRLFVNLTKMLSRSEEQTLREFALVLLVNLSSADTGIARAVALTGNAIPQLISFVEQSEHSAMSVAQQHGVTALRDNPELMGTTLDMVRRAALCLRHLSRIPENRPYFMMYQSRLLSLVMSQILDQGVAAIMADVMYECSVPSLCGDERRMQKNSEGTLLRKLLSDR